MSDTNEGDTSFNPETSACGNKPWCVRQIGHDGDCSSTFVSEEIDDAMTAVRETFVDVLLESGEETGGGDLEERDIVEVIYG